MNSTETKLRKTLIEYARKYDGKGISYTDLVEKAGVDLVMPQDRVELTNALTTIFEFEYNSGRELLSILVNYKGKMSIGGKFYKLLEKYHYNDSSEHSIKSIEFEIEQKGKVVAFWKNDEKYKEFL